MSVLEVDGDIYRKRGTPATRGGVAHEAQMLAALRHPGVVEFAISPGEDPQELLLRVAAGGDLRGRRFPPEEVAGLGAAAATTLADLHDLGAAHNALKAEHILLDRSGAPVLCSFSHASFETVPRRRAEQQARDVVDLIGVLCELLPEPGALQRRLQRAARQRHPSARALARMLARVEGARLPAAPGGAPLVEKAPAGSTVATEGGDGSEARSTPGAVVASAPAAGAGAAASRSTLTRPRRAKRVVLTAAVVGAMVAGGAAIIHAFGPSPGRVNCPAADAGCVPVPTSDGVISLPNGRWSLGEAGAVVVVGRWHCGTALPAVLQPATGQVWVFDRWAEAGTDVTGQPVARVAGAVSLAVLPGKACDRLATVGASGSRRVVPLGTVP